MQQALAFINQGRLQEAEAIYKRLIQQGAGNHLVFGNLGAICIMQGRNQEATTFLRQALAIKPDFLDALANLGGALQKQGDLDAAIASYRKALDLKPNDPETLNNLGTALGEQGDLEAAIDAYQKALALKPKYPAALANLGSGLRQQGHPEAAIDACQKALAIQPDFTDALSNLGNVFKDQGKMEAAIASHRKALAIKPDSQELLLNLASILAELAFSNPEAICINQDRLQEAEAIYKKLIQQGAEDHFVFGNLGLICIMQGRNQEATTFLRQALAIKPDFLDALVNLGVALQKQGELDAAIDAYGKALAMEPNDPMTLNKLGAALGEQGDLDAAIDAYQKALAIKPDFPDTLYNLAVALRHQGKMEAAIASYRKVLAIKPDSKELLLKLVSTLLETGDLQPAIELARKAVSLDPDDALGHFALAMLLLLSGDYGEGWKEYKWRFAAKKATPHARPKLEEWDGNNHTPGEQITVICEQGLGDTLQFMRYIPYLKTMGVDVYFCAQPKLHGLIRISGIATTLCDPDTASGLATGKWVSLLSLPTYLKVSPHNPLTNTAYLKAPEPQVLHWQQKLAAEHGPVIGLNWQGNPQPEKDGSSHLKGRSLPLAALAPLPQATAASFLSLQKGPGSEQLMDCSFKHRFVTCQEEINQTWDFLDTAAIVVNCDLIITVDTAVAHLAAGLGKPTWLLLKKVPDWRWGMEGDTTFWYPSMRLFRQRERGNWAEVMERVARALEALPGDQNYN